MTHPISPISAPCRFPFAAPRGLAATVGVTLLIALVTRGALVEAQVTPPLPPLALINSVAGTRATFAWATNPQGPTPTAFFLQAGSGPGLSDLAVVQLPGNQTAFAADAPPGTYYVRVVAFNALGASAPSNEVIVVITGAGGCTIPGPPTGLVATPTSSNVTLRWVSPASGGAPTGYVLDVGSATGQSNLGSFPLPNTTSLTAPAPPGQYFVRLRAVNGCGSSAPSAEVSFTIAAAAPVVPLPAGIYNGTMFGNQRPGQGRPPITSFQLTLNQPTPAIFSPIIGRWADNAGCVRTNPFLYAGPSNGQLIIDVESLACNDGDLALRVTSVSGTVVQGTCNGGPSCTFTMIRQ